MSEDRDFIELCKVKLRDRMNWSTDFEIRQRDFEYLSQEIYKTTQTELSTTTLRRIWSNQYKAVPQVHTLDALAKFLGYEHWNDFKSKNREGSQGIERRRPKLRKEAILIIGALLVVVVGLVLISASSGLEASSKSSVIFETDQSVYHEVPATAGFKYDISAVEEDVQIELSWNPYERVLLDKNLDFYTGVYFYPDYHYAKLLIGDRIIAFQPVHVVTDDWHASFMRSDFETRPIYLEPQEFFKEDRMEVSKETLDRHDIAKGDTLYTEYVFSNLMLDTASIEDIIVEARVKNVDYGSPRLCKTFRLFLKAENGFALIPFSEPGCYGELDMVFSDQVLRGKFNDLSSLTTDLNEWKNLKIEVKDFKVRIVIGNNEPYEFTYQQALGRLKAVKMMFTGLGAIDYVEVTGNNQSTVLRDDFLRPEVNSIN